MENKLPDVRKVSLTWKNVTAKVGDKRILDDISGYCQPG